MMPVETFYPVAIVGGGPVGLTLSIELSRLGVRHLLVNEAARTSTHPKCNTTNSRSMEHYRRLGVSQSLRFGGLPADYPLDIVYLTHLAGEEIARVQFPSPRDAVSIHDPSWQSPEPQHRISQIFLERILKEAAQREPCADVRFGWRVEAVRQDEEAAELRLRRTEDGIERSVRARWVVGCDGARSTVRRSCDISYAGQSKAERAIFGGSMVATYYRSHALAEIVRPKRGFMLWTLNERVRAVTVAIDGVETFLTHIQAPAGIDAATLDPLQFLPQIVGRPFAFDVLSSATWNAGYQLVAERYRHGRIFIAGDAAHLFTPTGGFGMNTGVDDVANLAWKLWAMESGWGGSLLLDSYDAERRPIGIRNTSAASAIADIIGSVQIPSHIEAADERGVVARAHLRQQVESVAIDEFMTAGVQLGARYEGSPIIVPDGTPAPPDSRTRYQPSARPGSRLPHCFLADGTSIFDRLGSGYTLVSLCAGATALESFRDAARVRGVPLDVLRLEDSRLIELYGADLVLVRPDQHVAWRASNSFTSAASTLSIIDTARGAAGTAAAMHETGSAPVDCSSGSGSN